MAFEIQGNNLINYLNNLQKSGKTQQSSNVSEPLFDMKKEVASDNVYESMGISISHRPDPTFQGMEAAAPEFNGMHKRFSGNLALSDPAKASETLASYAKFTQHLAKAPEVEEHLAQSPYQFV